VTENFFGCVRAADRRRAHPLLWKSTGANSRRHCNRKEPNMNKDQVKGVAEQVKGKVNEAVGKATGNKAKELKGDLQQGAGEIRKAYGDGKEHAKDNAKRNAP